MIIFNKCVHCAVLSYTLVIYAALADMAVRCCGKAYFCHIYL